MKSLSNFKIRNAVRHINAGDVIAYPTEAVYGLGCDPLNESAVSHLLKIKQRPVEKGLILVAASLEQLQPYLLLNKTILERISPTWPGPVTWVIPVQAWVPKWLRGEHDSIAVRVSNHPIVRQLCTKYGAPIVSTSANPANKPAIKNVRKLQQTFANTGIFILNGSIGSLKQETAIYDAVTGKRLR